LKDYDDWRHARREVLTIAASPSVEVIRITDVSEEPPPVPVTIHRAAGDSFRSGGPQFGTLVHAIIRDAPWGADAERLERLAAMHARLLGANRQEKLDAAQAAGRLLAHPLLQRAAASSRCFRELPITFPLSGNQILEGVIDLAFVDQRGWYVVDYKTDEDLHANQRVYERQLRWYAHALSTVTGQPAEGALLHV
jgi:ATP-dependent helicase/nuclease subunit A